MTAMLVLALPLLLQTVATPAYSPPREQRAPDPAALALVVGDTGTQTDPQPLCPDESCTAMFLGAFRNARTVAGMPLPTMFSARVEMGSPFDRSYRLALIVEQRPGAELLVHAQTGFHGRTKLACFDRRDTDRVNWVPSGEGISIKNGAICVQGE